MTPKEAAAKGIRATVLRTLIELYVGNRDASRASLCVALDAHKMLSDEPMADTYKNEQLRDLYPELCWVKTEDEQYFADISEGKPRPIAIYNRADAIAYYESSEPVREWWNRYAQAQADEFSKDFTQGEAIGGYVSTDRDGNLTSWAPPTWFPEWLKAR